MTKKNWELQRSYYSFLNIGTAPLDTEVEMIVEDDVLILKPIKRLRENWFNDYDAKNDVEPFEEMKAFDSEHEDWEW